MASRPENYVLLIEELRLHSRMCPTCGPICSSASTWLSRRRQTPALWMRTPGVDTVLAPALAAYATDLTLIGTALRPLHGLGQRGNGTQFTSAVTSHTLWLHRPFRTRRMADASPTQSTARPRPLLRTGRHPHRKRQPGRLVRPGGPPAGADLTPGQRREVRSTKRRV
jgi:hypothetical protein